MSQSAAHHSPEKFGFWHTLLIRARIGQPGSGRPKKRRLFRPRLEALEDRTLLTGAMLSMGNSGPVALDLLRLGEPAAAASSMSSAGMSIGLSSSLIAHDHAGRVGVTIDAANPDALVGRLQAMGAVVTGVAENLHTLDVFVPVNQIPNLAALTAEGMTLAMAMGKPLTSAVYDQGQAVLETDRLQAANGLTGAGLNVGVLSDSFNIKGGAATDVAQGDLPAGGVNVLQEGPNTGTDEGRAMAQIVHHLAPGSGIAFASADFGQTAFAQSIQDLANPTKGNAKVITDDVFYFQEPFFQDGVIAQAINTVAAAGVTYTTAAGNLGNNAYENTSPTFTSDSIFTANGANFLNFGTAANPSSRQPLTLTPGQGVIITLEWDNPFYNASGDTSSSGIFLVTAGGSSILAGSDTNTLNTGSPVQTVSYQNNTGVNQNVDLMILNDFGTRPGRIKWVNEGANEFGPVQVNMFATNSPTLVPHAGATGAIATAAAPYFNQATPENFSAFGPQTILFSPDGKTTLGPPQVRAKPDVTAVDGVSTSFFPSAANRNFFGTSAAAPHAAAVAALYLQANPGATPVQVKAALVSSAHPMYANSNNVAPLANVNQVGAGIISAYRAVNGAPVPVSLNVNSNFDSNTALSNAWTNSSRFTGQVQVGGTFGSVSPVTSPNQLVLNEIDNTFGFGAASEANLNVAAPSATDGNDVGISFEASAIGGLPSNFALPATFTTFTNGTGIAISTDGINWKRVIDLSGVGTSYALSRLNLSSIASAAALSLTSNFQLRFQAVTLSTLPNQGLAFDNLQISRLSATGSGSGITTQEGSSTGTLTNLATFTDGASPVGSYTASIAWGDAASSSASVAINGGQLAISSTGHTYAEEGTFTYTVTITDTITGRTATTTGHVTVSDAAVVALAGSPSPTAGAPFAGAVATFTDPNGAELNDGTHYSASIAWGDNTPATTGTITLFNGVFTVSGTHTYAAANSFSIMVTINHELTTTPLSEMVSVTSLGQFVQPGLIKPISFWAGLQGQELLRRFGTTASGQTLGQWLATTYPNLYGGQNGAPNLSPFTNGQISSYYLTLFLVSKGTGLDAEVLATALEAFATTTSLGGSVGQSYGFTVNSNGLGAYSWNVGASGQPFGVNSNTVLDVYQILLAANNSAAGGEPWGSNTLFRNEAFIVFHGINGG
ncbi:MAG TPA: S8 family serine peptidase [Gemmataceae bacterium]|nr:S8 family serine peptidase [Gemmataceae bacterium]